MARKQPMPGAGQFRWNTGGWFGAQVGGTSWLLVGAVVMAPQAPWLAAWWAACFLAANAVGFEMWRRRNRLRPYPAIQALLATCGVAGLMAAVALHAYGSGAVKLALVWGGGAAREDITGGSLSSLYAVLLVGIPAMMGWFAVLDRAGRRARPGGDASGPGAAAESR